MFPDKLSILFEVTEYFIMAKAKIRRFETVRGFLAFA